MPKSSYAFIRKQKLKQRVEARQAQESGQARVESFREALVKELGQDEGFPLWEFASQLAGELLSLPEFRRGPQLRKTLWE